MADPGIGDYLRAAFKVPYNLILFTGGMLAGVVSLHPHVVWPFVIAAELVYLSTLATRPRFQDVVRARRAAARKAERSEVVPRVVASLSPERQQRFERLRARCADLQRAIGDGADELSGILEGQQLQGVNKLLWVFLRTLVQEQSLADFCATMPRREIETTLAETRRAIDGGKLSDGMREAHAENARVLELRLENLKRAEENLATIAARLVRVENSVLLIQEQALTRRDPGFVEAEVRSVTEGLQSVEAMMRSMNLPQVGEIADEATPEFLGRGPSREKQAQ